MKTAEWISTNALVDDMGFCLCQIVTCLQPLLNLQHSFCFSSVAGYKVNAAVELGGDVTYL